jgi:hypothetical protein
MVRKMAVDREALQVLKSFRPYLGPQGNKMADVLDGFLELLFSEPVQNYFVTLRNSIGINIPWFLLFALIKKNKHRVPSSRLTL